MNSVLLRHVGPTSSSLASSPSITHVELDRTYRTSTPAPALLPPPPPCPARNRPRCQQLVRYLAKLESRPCKYGYVRRTTRCTAPTFLLSPRTNRSLCHPSRPICLLFPTIHSRSNVSHAQMLRELSQQPCLSRQSNNPSIAQQAIAARIPFPNARQNSLMGERCPTSPVSAYLWLAHIVDIGEFNQRRSTTIVCQSRELYH